MGKLGRGLLWVVGIAAIVAVVLRLLLFKVWTIPDDPVLSASLAPTMSGGDTVVVLTRGTPGFGDLVRCPDPEDAQRWIVGRIVGLGGDVVELQANELLVNSKRYVGESVCAQAKHKLIHPYNLNEVEVRCDIVSMGGGWHYRGTGAGVKQPAIRADVRPGMVYLLSDNRDLHDDSRDFGPVPAETCKERIVFRLSTKAGWNDTEGRMTVIR
jgi:signal peptidase I